MTQGASSSAASLREGLTASKTPAVHSCWLGPRMQSTEKTGAEKQRQLQLLLSKHALEVIRCCQQPPMHLLQKHLQKAHATTGDTPSLVTLLS